LLNDVILSTSSHWLATDFESVVWTGIYMTRIGVRGILRVGRSKRPSRQPSLLVEAYVLG